MLTELRPFCPVFLGSALFVAAACGSSDDHAAGTGGGSQGGNNDGGGAGEAGAGGGGGSSGGPDGGVPLVEISGLDPSFGAGAAGYVTLDLGGGQDALQTLAAQSDGSVVLVGRNSSDGAGFVPGDLADLFVGRFTPTGQPDPGFGTQGKTLLTTAGFANAKAAVVQPDGKTVVVGGTVRFDSPGSSFLAARIALDGTFDASFGKSGLVADVPGEAHAVALQPDGKIVVIGDSDDSMAVVRYAADGTRDASFGTGGLVKIKQIDVSGGSTIAVQSDGAIVVTGFAVSTVIRNSHYEALVARLTPSGALDTTFAGTGSELFSSPTGDFYIDAMGLGPANAITIAVGQNADVGLGQYSFERLTSSGGGDATYGTGGDYTLPTAGRLMAVEPTGSVVYTTYLSPTQVLRVTAAGAPDPSFGTNGTSAATAQPGLLRAFGRSANGSYFIGGQVDGTGLTATHVTAAGAADSAYGTSGYAIVASGASREELTGVAVQADGKILTVGRATGGLQSFVARWDASGAPDASFGTGGRVLEYPVGVGTLVGPVLAPGGGFYVGYSVTSGGFLSLLKYDATGAHDDGFGTKGTVTFTDAYLDPTGLALDSQGRPLVTGGAQLSTVRYTTAGVPDDTFGTKGLAIVSGNAATGQAVAAQADGTILVAGASASSAAVVRYTDSGTADPGFGTAGILSFPQANLRVQRILPQTGGAALLVGSTAGSTAGILLARVTAAGVLDTTFGTGGLVAQATGAATIAVDAVIQGDGVLVSTTVSDDGLHEQMLFLRYTANGALDPAFGTGGQLKLSVGKGNDVAAAMTLDSAGRPVVAGRTWSPATGADGLLLRLK
jgi:uncharacterized delta-60 repeat protein